MEYSDDRGCGSRSDTGWRVASENGGSVRRDGPSNCAYLKFWNDRPKLNWNWDDNANPQYGSASRWDCLVRTMLLGVSEVHGYAAFRHPPSMRPIVWTLSCHVLMRRS